MRAAVLTKYSEPLELVERELPTFDDDGALIRVERVGVCGTDAHQWNNDWAHAGLTVQLPRVLGHEVAGIVHAVGSAVTSLRVGDRVTIPFHLSCARCQRCLAGLSNICNASDYLGATVDGGFAEFVSVPRADFTCVSLPPEISVDAAASLGCRYMTAYRAVFGVAPVSPGETVVVLGAAGGVGSALLQLLAAARARIVAVDLPERLTEIQEDAVIGRVDAQSSDIVAAIGDVALEADVVIDAHGGPDALQTSFAVLRNGGRHIQVGMGRTDPLMPLNLATVKELSFHAVNGNPHSAFPGLIELVRSGACRPADLVQRTVGFGQLTAAIEDLATHRGRGGFAVFDPTL